MTGVDRLVARLRAALGTEEARLPAGEGPAAADAGGAAPADRFRAAFRAADGIAIDAPSPDAALPALAEILQSAGVKGLLAPANDPPAAALALALVPFGPFTLVSAGEVCGGSPPVAAGVQTAEFAVAETGTIVQTSAGGTTLVPGLLPEVHVALVPAGRILARMEDVLAALAGEVPRNISFLTGPSRTGDIEQTLIVGAHGPRRLVALLLPEPSRPTTPTTSAGTASP